MDNYTIFTKTAKGLGETLGKTKNLSRDNRKILKEIDGKAALGDVQDKLDMDPVKLQIALTKLLADDYIREFGSAAPMHAAVRAITSMGDTEFGLGMPGRLENANSQLTIGDFFRAVEDQSAEAESLDFKALLQDGKAGPQEHIDEVVQLQQARRAVEEEARRKFEGQAQRAAEARARQQAEEQAHHAADQAAREAAAQASKLAEQQARQQAAEQAKREAAARLEKEAQAARQKAEQEARRIAEEQARQQAEQQARQAAELQARAEAEHRARHAAEQQARQAAEEQARRDAEEQARQQALARAEQEALQQARLQAEEKARQAAEDQARRDAEAQALREAEQQARRQAEEQQAKEEAQRQARLQAEQQARREAEQRAQAEAQARKEAETQAQAQARAKQEAEEQARQDAIARAEAEAAQQAQEQAQRLAEEQARKEAHEQARMKAHAAARRVAEELAQREVETRARREAEEQTRLAAEQAERQAAETRARAEAEEQARQEAQAQARQAAEEQARREAAEQARQAAEEQARRDTEEQARQQAQARAEQDALQQARLQAEEKARQAAEEQARRDAEAQAKKDAKERARQEAEEQARIKAEEKARQKAAEQARKDAEAQAKKDAKERARQEAEQQTRIKAEEKARQAAEARAVREAEQRAREEAKAEAEARARARTAIETGPVLDTAEPVERTLGQDDAQQADSPATLQAGTIAGRAPAARKPWLVAPTNMAKLVRFGVLGLIVALICVIGLVHVIPFGGMLARIEAAASEQLQQPVSIGRVRLSLFPQPHWRLDDVAIGKEGQIIAPQVDAHAGLASLFGDQLDFNAIEFHSPVITDQGLDWLLFGTGKGTGKATGFGAASISATNAQLKSQQVRLPAFEAAAEMREDGGWDLLVLRAIKENIRIELRPKGDAVQADLTAQALVLPFGSSLQLDEFNFTGMLSRSDLTITKFNGLVYDGVISGTGLLKWGPQWSLTGELSAKHVDPVRIMPALLQGGRLEGDMNYTFAADDAGKLMTTLRGKGNFAVANGTLLGVDLANLVMGQNGSGKSSFTQLSGDFVTDDGKTQLSGMQLRAGLLSAGGNAAIDAQNKLSGNFTVDLKTTSRQARANLALSGTLEAPKFRR